MKDEVTNVLRLANLVRENVRTKQLFTPYNSILVTLSGGQDSICSLFLLYLLQNQLGLEFEVAPRLTGTTFRQARTELALSAAGAVHRAAPSGHAPNPSETNRPPVGLRVVRPCRRPLGPLVLVPSLDVTERLLSKAEHALVQNLGIDRAEPADSAIGIRSGNCWPCSCSASLSKKLSKASKSFANRSAPSGHSYVPGRVSPPKGGARSVYRTLLGKSSPKTSKMAVHSDLYSTGLDQTLFDFEKSARLLGQFGLLWCNHFWQKESFHTMLHVAKINLCFSSTMCFYLSIENVLCEQNAREWRHKSIQRTCAFFHFKCCTQGHTKSDRVETILFNILRGTGIAGLQSLQWKKSFYSFSSQRFYPRLSYSKLNWPQSTANSTRNVAMPRRGITVGEALAGQRPAVALLKLPPAGRSSYSSKLSTGPRALELDKVGDFSKYCLVNFRTEATFRLSTRCSYRPRRRLGLSTGRGIRLT